jgi:hypothetical protein
MDPSNSIRAPDEAKIEQLTEDTRSEYDKQIEEAMHLSITDFIVKEEIYKKYEADILEEHHAITRKRRDIFHRFLFDVNKLIRFDKDIKEIYEIIEPIIDAYCEQYIKEYEIDSLTYDRIFKIVSNIRTDKKNIELLKTILIRN